MPNTLMELGAEAQQRRAHQLLYGCIMRTTRHWLGVPVRKSPLDLWAIQDLIYRLRPQLIIETGTAFGGSAYFYASLLDLLHYGEVITIDNDSTHMRPPHPRITYVTGSSVEAPVVAAMTDHCKGPGLPSGKAPVLVILDSDHRAEHVLAELNAYAPLVTAGSYLVVEDTNINGWPVLPGFGPGPHEAVAAFLASAAGASFSADLTVEPPLTFNPGGFLRRR